jgi:hypothetical protein
MNGPEYAGCLDLRLVRAPFVDGERGINLGAEYGREFVDKANGGRIVRLEETV